jgi:predicted TIM-barrel fold metal-dependent hydrolase
MGCLVAYGIHALLPPEDSAWQGLAELAQSGAWLKLSGWYRLQASAPYEYLDSVMQRATELFDTHLVWGSDWPHTSFSADSLPDYASTWQPVARALPATRHRLVACDAPAILYA